MEEYFLERNGEMVRKEVVYFPKLVKGNVKLQEKEILEGGWVDVKKAYDLVTYQQSKKICLEVQRFLEA